MPINTAKRNDYNVSQASYNKPRSSTKSEGYGKKLTKKDLKKGLIVALIFAAFAIAMFVLHAIKFFF